MYKCIEPTNLRVFIHVPFENVFRPLCCYLTDLTVVLLLHIKRSINAIRSDTGFPSNLRVLWRVLRIRSGQHFDLRKVNQCLHDMAGAAFVRGVFSTGIAVSFVQMSRFRDGKSGHASN